ALAGRPSPYGEEELRELAAHCTEQEGNAAKVERQVHKSAAAMLLESRTGAQFDAMVTGASDKGVWVRILHPLAEGRLVRGFEALDVGDPVRVQLVRTDVERGHIDFVRVRCAGTRGVCAGRRTCRSGRGAVFHRTILDDPVDRARTAVHHGTAERPVQPAE